MKRVVCGFAMPVSPDLHPDKESFIRLWQRLFFVLSVLADNFLHILRDHRKCVYIGFEVVVSFVEDVQQGLERNVFLPQPA